MNGDYTPQNVTEAQDEIVQPELTDPENDSDNPDLPKEAKNHDDKVTDPTTEPGVPQPKEPTQEPKPR